jgi:hypothetical protein
MHSVAFSVWAEFMVRVKVRVAVRVVVAFSVWTQFTVPTGKRSGHPRGMPLVTRMQELQGTCVGSNSILERANFCRETRTVQQPQPNNPNPNTAESMVKNAHRTALRSRPNGRTTFDRSERAGADL